MGKWLNICIKSCQARIMELPGGGGTWQHGELRRSESSSECAYLLIKQNWLQTALTESDEL